MKVYELMEALSQMPSGAEVSARRLMTLKEFVESETIEDSLYSIEIKIKEVVDTGEQEVQLYA